MIAMSHESDACMEFVEIMHKAGHDFELCGFADPELVSWHCCNCDYIFGVWKINVYDLFWGHKSKSGDARYEALVPYGDWKNVYLPSCASFVIKSIIE